MSAAWTETALDPDGLGFLPLLTRRTSWVRPTESLRERRLRNEVGLALADEGESGLARTCDGVVGEASAPLVCECECECEVGGGRAKVIAAGWECRRAG